MSDEKQKKETAQKPLTDKGAKPAGPSLAPLYLALFTGAFLLLGDVLQAFYMWDSKARIGATLLMTAITMLMAKDLQMRVYCGVVIWGALVLTFWL